MPTTLSAHTSVTDLDSPIVIAAPKAQGPAFSVVLNEEVVRSRGT